ncbi:EutP/PduV family microcompartment system protein [uncultured Cetobacterium sp.]|uniref:EutP/PduV family microcompartment system protein n=1 Tax=uncultured Cetobacterium sp. TaxID=527638 RepID=UPI00260DB886|nr:EutP/PduV family microcompartment system protein [uncultured Cetobacterium sp.]
MKIMLVGRTGCGKTTLTQRLNKEVVKYKKTQMVSYEGDIIDTPGEYIENKGYYRALNVISMDADIIILIQSSLDDQTLFPPNFASMFNGKKIYGVITKIDIDENIEQSESDLRNAGATEIFKIGLEKIGDFHKLKEKLGVIM